MFGVTILGNNSALLAYDRHPTSQVVTLNDQLLLIDCGEGTQMRLARFKVRRSRINHIFISHLHGDHYFGLAGLITSMGLLGREHDLNIYAPAPLKAILDLQLEAADTRLPFTLNFCPLEEEGMIVENERFSVENFKVMHRIDCRGFLIREKRKLRRVNREQALAYEVPTAFYDRLKNGEDYINKNNETIKNELVTTANSAPKSYAYCADTLYTPLLADRIKDVTLLYHEATYLKDLEDRATDRFHSTTVQAAAIAQLANAKRLLIGHFSSQYECLDAFLEEAQSVFANTELALEGVTYIV